MANDDHEAPVFGGRAPPEVVQDLAVQAVTFAPWDRHWVPGMATVAGISLLPGLAFDVAFLSVGNLLMLLGALALVVGQSALRRSVAVTQHALRVESSLFRRPVSERVIPLESIASVRVVGWRHFTRLEVTSGDGVHRWLLGTDGDHAQIAEWIDANRRRVLAIEGPSQAAIPVEILRLSARATRESEPG